MPGTRVLSSVSSSTRPYLITRDRRKTWTPHLHQSLSERDVRAAVTDLANNLNEFKHDTLFVLWRTMLSGARKRADKTTNKERVKIAFSGVFRTSNNGIESATCGTYKRRPADSYQVK